MVKRLMQTLSVTKVNMTEKKKIVLGCEDGVVYEVDFEEYVKGVTQARIEAMEELLGNLPPAAPYTEVFEEE